MESIREESQKRIMWRFNLASSTIGVEKLMFAGVHQFQTKKIHNDSAYKFENFM